MGFKLLIFNNAEITVIHHLDFFDRLSSFVQFRELLEEKGRTMMTLPCKVALWLRGVTNSETFRKF